MVASRLSMFLSSRASVHAVGLAVSIRDRPNAGNGSARWLATSGSLMATHVRSRNPEASGPGFPVGKKIRSRAHEEKVVRGRGALVFAVRKLRETRSRLNHTAGEQLCEVLRDERCIHGWTVCWLSRPLLRHSRRPKKSPSGMTPEGRKYDDDQAPLGVFLTTDTTKAATTEARSEAI